MRNVWSRLIRKCPLSACSCRMALRFLGSLFSGDALQGSETNARIHQSDAQKLVPSWHGVHCKTPCIRIFNYAHTNSKKYTPFRDCIYSTRKRACLMFSRSLNNKAPYCRALYGSAGRSVTVTVRRSEAIFVSRIELVQQSAKRCSRY